MRKVLVAGLVLVLSAVACGGGSDVDIADIPPLPETTTDAIERDLATSDVPVVLNVWASWCIPCRSEGPLLDRAATEFAGEVRFIGLNVRDGQDDARSFIAEFFPEAPIDHVADPPGNIPVDLGGSRAVPLTFFYAAGGELVELHTGVLDERTLALQIDELLAR
jgi:thiol-disulfide isomerase/thioredoxin